ncbi:MAG: hypothetical protein V2A59_00425 [Candidatus Omnitrophota bacterium]
MKQKPSLGFFILALILSICFILADNAQAAFDVSANPYQGGYDLRFDKITPDMGRINREVTVRITSDIAKQYRLSNMFVQPLSTLEGARLPEGSFVVYGIRGSNSFGTINVEEEVPVRLGSQIIYTSNGTGNSDSFTLVYSILPSPNIVSGSYKGKLGFTLEPIDSTQQQVTVMLDVLAEFQIESAIEIKTLEGSKVISLKADKEDNRSSAIAFNIKGGFGKQFAIVQLVNEQPVSPEGNFLSWEAVAFRGMDAQRGMAINEETALSNRQQVIYTSSPAGDADSFILEYRLGDLMQQKAGKYRTSIRYLVEGLAFPQTKLIDTLSLEVENPAIFDITIYPENQKGVIEFLNLRPTDEPKKNEMVIEVKSNTAKQYQVTQNVYSELVNKSGEVIRAKYFNLSMQSLETKGTMKFLAPESVKKGYTVLFVSDNKGSPDKFKVIYELAVSRDIKSGDYSTKITYSLSEL